MTKKLALLILGVIIITLLVAPVAMAATPQDIYNDFVSHGGKLTGTYTQAELKAYLNDATLHQYGNTTVSQLDDLVNQLLNRSTFPFTGFQMLIAGVVAVALVGGGFALRRVSRQS